MSVVDPQMLLAIREETVRASHQLSVWQNQGIVPDARAIETFTRQSLEMRDATQRFLAANPLPDPEILQAMAEEAARVYEQARRLAKSGALPNANLLRALAKNAQQVYERAQSFLRSSPLPPPDVLRALMKEHLELLSSLDIEFGPPSEEDTQEARKILAELRVGV